MLTKPGEDDLAVQVGDLGGVGVPGFQSVAGADLHDAVALDGHSTVEKTSRSGLTVTMIPFFQQMVDHSSCAPFQISRRKLPASRSSCVLGRTIFNTMAVRATRMMLDSPKNICT